MTLFVFQGNVKFALDIISICEILENRNTSMFFEYTYGFGIETKIVFTEGESGAM